MLPPAALLFAAFWGKFAVHNNTDQMGLVVSEYILNHLFSLNKLVSCIYPPFLTIINIYNCVLIVIMLKSYLNT